MNAEDVEEIRRRNHDTDFFGIAGARARVGDRAAVAAKSRRRDDRATCPGQVRDVGTSEPAALEIEHRTVVTPDEIQIIRPRIRQRLDEYFLNDGGHDAERAEPDDEGADHR